MAEGRGSASTYRVALAIYFLVLLSVHGYVAEGARYSVGDNNGWTFGVTDWTKGKNFKAGDVLDFNYNGVFHNVVVVDGASYKACTVPANASMYMTGKDSVTLKKGDNFFICSIGFHCQFGMKISAPAT